ASAKLRIITFFGDELLGRAVQFETELLLGKPLFEALKLDLDDVRELLFVEAVEDNDVIDPVEELGPEMSAQFRLDEAFHLGIFLGTQLAAVVVLLDEG